MIIDELFEAPQQCPECGGISFSNLILAEKKDACYHKVKASAKVWPSAYASGRLVQCRKKGAANYGNKSEGVAEGLPQTLRKVVPGYAKREIDKKMDAGKFGKTDADKDANFQRYKKIQDKLKEQGVAEGYVPINISKMPTDPAPEPKKVKKDYTPKYDPQVHGPVYDLEWQRQQNEKRWYNVVRKSDGKVLNPEPIKGQTAAEEFRKQNGLGGGNADLVQVSTLRFHATGIDASGKRVVSEPLLSMKDVRNFYKQHGINQFASTTDLTTTDEGSVAEGVMYGAENLHVGDDVIISGDVELNGATGVIDSFGQDKRFVVVNLFNHGPHSFHSSDVSANDYDRDEHDDDMLETRRGQIPMTLNPGETDNLEPENLAGFRALPAYKQGQAAQQKAGKQLIQKSPYTFQSDQDWAYRQGAFDTQQAAMFANFGKSKPLTIEGGEQQKGADYRDPKEVDYDDEYDAMVARVKKLAGLGPMKTVYDPNKRVYRNMPTAVQPKK